MLVVCEEHVDVGTALEEGRLAEYDCERRRFRRCRDVALGLDCQRLIWLGTLLVSLWVEAALSLVEGKSGEAFATSNRTCMASYPLWLNSRS